MRKVFQKIVPKIASFILVAFAGSFFVAPLASAAMPMQESLAFEYVEYGNMHGMRAAEVLVKAGAENPNDLAPCCVTHKNEFEKAVFPTTANEKTKTQLALNENVGKVGEIDGGYKRTNIYFSSSPPGGGLVSCVIKLE